MTNEENRISWVEKELKKIPAGHRLLDAGAGEQQFRKYCTHLEYVSQDFAQYDPSKEKNGLQMEKWDYGKLDLVSDITSIPVPDHSFDAILCTEVFEHIPDPISALKEFSRILKTNGRLILTAPFCSMTHFAPYHYYSGFNRAFFTHHLLANHFGDITVEANGNYFEFLQQEMQRLDHMAKEYAGEFPGRLEYASIKKVRRLLERLAEKGNGSNELLCFGFHVTAKRN